MVLRTLRTAFILAGLTILLSNAGDVHGAIRANLTGQGSTVREAAIGDIPTMELRQHWSAPELQRRSVSAEIALGSMLFLLGMGLHAYLMRRKGTEQAVKVHAAPVRRGRETRKVDRWFLWMTVRM